MQTINPGLSNIRLAFIAIAATFSMSAALAQVAAGTTGIDASGNYEKEVQACRTGRTQQDIDTCLREARNARADKAALKTPSPSQKTSNALSRCEPLTGDDKIACQARVVGYGAKSGSVAGGGVVKSVEVVKMPAGAASVPIPPSAGAPVVLTPAPAK